MAFLRSLVFTLLFYPGTLVYVLASFVAAAFGTKALRTTVHGWAYFHYWLVRKVLGIRFEWDGDLPPGPYLIAVKHQAMVEAVDTLRFARTPVVVMKRELSHMPLFGWVTRKYGVIGVDRDAGAKALREMMVKGKEAAADGRPVIIFPEGTRVPFGEAPELRPGFAGLYRVLGLPVIPVAHDSGKIWPRGFIKHSGVIRFKVGEIIPPGLKREEIEARVHAAINALNS
ncbi:lysophospholipid acyltransferase family protein [Sphingomonas jaspsi]|uniref:lysophospholipid acyltransferase family protein n=1 Tax=Sphingomonas jaspsi TaxID=392409 RepID=UPI000562E5AE|nr:lysophospholipid acyltransferase family protein [Sphingomonas jaspsi]